MEFGGLYVMTSGIHKMPEWFANNWNTLSLEGTTVSIMHVIQHEDC